MLIRQLIIDAAFLFGSIQIIFIPIVLFAWNEAGLLFKFCHIHQLILTQWKRQARDSMMKMSDRILLLMWLASLNNIIQSIPNVLFIVVDDLRPALGIYGDTNAHTPNIDALAKRSFYFNKAYAQQALCAPSRTSFLTSRRPDTLHLYDFYSYWRTQAGNYTTIPQYFKENGYHTHSIGKVFHPGISSNGTDDFPLSWSQKPFHPPTEIYKESPTCPDKYGHRRNLVCPVELPFQPDQTLPDLQSLAEAIDFLESRENEVDSSPFFLAVGFHKPHLPLKYPKKYLAFHPLENVTIAPMRARPYQLPSVAWNPWTDVRERDDIADLKIPFPYGHMPTNWIKLITQSYNAAVTYIDDLIGKLLKEVDQNTIIILIGDHGWSLGEHGEWSKFSNYDVATRVPFILHIPEIPASGKPINTPVELVDIFPTVVDLIDTLENIPQCTSQGNEIQLCTEGMSLVPMLTSSSVAKQSKRAAFMQYPRPGVQPTKSPNSDKPRLRDIKIMGYSIVTDMFRYTEWVGFNNTNFQPDWLKLYGVELYHKEIDAMETMNLAERGPYLEVRKKLSEQLRTGWKSFE